MKRIIFSLLILVSFFYANSQNNYIQISQRYRWIAGKFDSTLTVPSGTTPSLRGGGYNGPGGLFYKTTDSSLYTWTGTQFLRLAKFSDVVATLQQLFDNESNQAQMTTNNKIKMNGHRFTFDGGSSSDFYLDFMRLISIIADDGSMPQFLLAAYNNGGTSSHIELSSTGSQEVGLYVTHSSYTDASPQISLYAGQAPPSNAKNNMGGTAVMLQPDSITLDLNRDGGNNGKLKIRGLKSTSDTTYKALAIRLSDSTVKVLDHWPAGTGGGGTPAGSNTEIQFNNSGAFGSSSNFTYDGNTVNIGGGSIRGTYVDLNINGPVDFAAGKGTIDFWAANGETPDMAVIGGINGYSVGMMPAVSSGTAGAKGILFYFDGIGWRSALEWTNVASGNTTLYAQKTGGELIVGSTDNGAYSFQNNGASYLRDGAVSATGSATYKHSGSLTVNTTDVGNVGAGEDNLMTYSIPASTLGTNGDYIEFKMTFKLAANANSKQVKVYYGSTQIYASGAATQNDGVIEITGQVIRTGATTQRITYSVSTSTTSFTDYADYVTAGETLSGAVTLKATGEAVSDNDIIQKIMTVKYFPGN